MTDKQYNLIIQKLDEIIADQRAMIETLQIPTRRIREEFKQSKPDRLVENEIEDIQLGKK